MGAFNAAENRLTNISRDQANQGAATMAGYSIEKGIEEEAKKRAYEEEYR